MDVLGVPIGVANDVAYFLRTPFGQLQTLGQTNWREGSPEVEEEGEIRDSSFFFVSRPSKFTNPSDVLSGQKVPLFSKTFLHI